MSASFFVFLSLAVLLPLEVLFPLVGCFRLLYLCLLDVVWCGVLLPNMMLDVQSAAMIPGVRLL